MRYHHGTANLEIGTRPVEVRYEEVHDEGAGSSDVAVVCMPGLACGDQYYAHTLRAARRRALSLCFPGEGSSPVPESGPLTTHDLVTVTREFLQERQIERTALVAHSRSGAVAVHLAVEDPRIERLVLVEPRLRVEDAQWVREIAIAGPIETANFRDEKAAELNLSDDRGRRLYYDDFRQTPAEVLYWYSSTLMNCLANDGVFEHLLNLRIPRTFMYGQANKGSMPLQELKASGVELVGLPGGHFPMYKDPVGFAGAVSEVLASQD